MCNETLVSHVEFSQDNFFFGCSKLVFAVVFSTTGVGADFNTVDLHLYAQQTVYMTSTFQNFSNAAEGFDVGLAIDVEKSMRLRRRIPQKTKFWVMETCCALQLPSWTVVANSKSQEMQRKPKQLVHIANCFWKLVQWNFGFSHRNHSQCHPLSAFNPTKSPQTLFWMLGSCTALEFWSCLGCSDVALLWNFGRRCHTSPSSQISATKWGEVFHCANPANWMVDTTKQTTHGIQKHETSTLKLRHWNPVLVKYFAHSRCQPFTAVAPAKSTETLSFECSERSLPLCFLNLIWLRTVIFWNASTAPTICWSQYQHFLVIFLNLLFVLRKKMECLPFIALAPTLSTKKCSRPPGTTSACQSFCNLCRCKNNRFTVQPLLSRFFQTELWSFWCWQCNLLLNSECVFVSQNHLRTIFGSSLPHLRSLHVVELQQQQRTIRSHHQPFKKIQWNSGFWWRNHSHCRMFSAFTPTNSTKTMFLGCSKVALF